MRCVANSRYACNANELIRLCVCAMFKKNYRTFFFFYFSQVKFTSVFQCVFRLLHASLSEIAQHFHRKQRTITFRTLYVCVSEAVFRRLFSPVQFQKVDYSSCFSPELSQIKSAHLKTSSIVGLASNQMCHICTLFSLSFQSLKNFCFYIAVAAIKEEKKHKNETSEKKKKIRAKSNEWMAENRGNSLHCSFSFQICLHFYPFE